MNGAVSLQQPIGKPSPPRPLSVRACPPGRTHGYYRFVIRLPHLRTDPEGLIGLISRLEQQGIHCRKPVFRPLHRYLDQSGFPNSDEADRTALSIPLYPDLTDDEVRQIQQSLAEVLS